MASLLAEQIGWILYTKTVPPPFELIIEDAAGHRHVAWFQLGNDRRMHVKLLWDWPEEMQYPLDVRFSPLFTDQELKLHIDPVFLEAWREGGAI